MWVPLSGNTPNIHARAWTSDIALRDVPGWGRKKPTVEKEETIASSSNPISQPLR